jgi:hypothetical protein
MEQGGEKLQRLSIRKALLGLMAVIVPIVLAGGALGQGEIVLTGLEAPRGLSNNGSYMLIAEQGTGRILQVSKAGTVSVVVDGLPTMIAETPEGPLPASVTNAIQIGDAYFYVLGENRGVAGYDSLYSVKPGQAPVLLADILAYEQANNIDGNLDMAGEPELLINAYDLVADNAGGFYISGSGSNAIEHVAADGTISVFNIFPNRENPLFPTIGGPEIQQVPTGLEWGPDGALYVTTLTGFPFVDNLARVYRMVDSNSDGDALDDGETTIYADGLTTATSLAFDTDGSLLVTEFSTNLLEMEPGRLVRVVDGSISEVVAEPLVSPTGVTVFNGQIIVAQEFVGIVAEASAGAAIIASGPPPSEGGGDITPPSTGDGGLAGSAPSSTALLLAAGLFAGAGLATRIMVSVRR